VKVCFSLQLLEKQDVWNPKHFRHAPSGQFCSILVMGMFLNDGLGLEE
jgi:hypothetical protein